MQNKDRDREREREREKKGTVLHRRDKTVSITRKRNKEKVENGLSPAFPKPKKLNACKNSFL